MEPIKFEPLLKQTLWGGEKIIPFKHLAQKLPQVGESWEISGVKGNETIVKNGEYKGKSLNEVVSELRDLLVGVENYKRFGNTFPLLIKFIDACQQLSIQVHPNDELARKRGFERGKTEMWYVMKSESYAALRSGLKKEITPNEYESMVANDTITDAIAEYKVKEGDCFFLPSGRIHSIGAGCFLAEIQQTSDVTYRIYDFKRKDKNGNYRQLHTKEAAECIDYHVENNYRTDYVPQKNKGVMLVRCPYFSTTVYDLDEPIDLDCSDMDSFVILVCVDGNGILTDNEGNVTSLNAGESLLIPATTKWLKVNGSVRFLETYI
jgi:mannose-6-phosphate isomerase